LSGNPPSRHFLDRSRIKAYHDSTPKTSERRKTVTVCIAALSRFNEASIVIGASDRMITAGDIEFEPPQTKIIQLTTSIAALTAGESSAQIEISGATLRDIKARLAIDKSWMGVNEVAQMFSAQVLKYRQRVAQRKFLEPFGLDFSGFIREQQQMSSDWVSEFTQKILSYNPDIETIIAGLDDSGGHIYVINGFGSVACKVHWVRCNRIRGMACAITIHVCGPYAFRFISGKHLTNLCRKEKGGSRSWSRTRDRYVHSAEIGRICGSLSRRNRSIQCVLF